ncbi:MAG: hypothetical protein ACO3RV_07720, partial [Luteolibacter sp.]
MSSNSIQILNSDRIPESGMLVVPGQLNFEQLLQVERLFQKRTITWLVEEQAEHDPSLRAYLEKSGSGAIFRAGDAAPELAGKQLQPYLANGGVLIYLPGRASTRNATACHIPASHLETLCGFSLPMLPIAIDCPRGSSLSIERRASLAPFTIAIGNPIPADKTSPAAYRKALLVAAEEAFRQRPLFNGSLAMALLHGLRKHSKKHVIKDGS